MLSTKNLTSSLSLAKQFNWLLAALRPYRLRRQLRARAQVRLQRQLPVPTHFRRNVPAVYQETLAPTQIHRPHRAPLQILTDGCPFGYQVSNGACCVPIACPQPTPTPPSCGEGEVSIFSAPPICAWSDCFTLLPNPSTTP